jgi:hypothetical protein
MSLDQQVALLRVIQEKKLTRIGGHDAIPVDVRIICATNRDLYSEMRTGSFRSDLYYRLNVINIKIPPLKERRGDIMLLFHHFMKTAEKKVNRKSSRINSDVEKHLVRYGWPGNVRELQNVVERVVNGTAGSSLEMEHLPQDIRMADPSSASPPERHWTRPVRRTPSTSRRPACDSGRSRVRPRRGRSWGSWRSITAISAGLPERSGYPAPPCTRRSGATTRKRRENVPPPESVHLVSMGCSQMDAVLRNGDTHRFVYTFIDPFEYKRMRN